MQQSILVVDDEEIVGITISRILEGEGFQVTYCVKAPNAIEEIVKRNRENQTFAAAIIDLKLRDIPGEALVREIHSLDPDLPLIAATGDFRARVFENPRQFGFVAVLRKPFRRVELLDLVGAHRRSSSVS